MGKSRLRTKRPKKNRGKLKKFFGLNDYGLVDLPKKISGTQISRALVGESEVGNWIQEQLNGKKYCQWNKPYLRDKVGSKGWMSVRAAITAVERNNNLKGLLQYCVDFTGDVDTVAIIAGAAASVSKYYEKNIPHELKIGLENGKYGSNYLIELDKKLEKKYG
jgi:hypothetical protein